MQITYNKNKIFIIVIMFCFVAFITFFYFFISAIGDLAGTLNGPPKESPSVRSFSIFHPKVKDSLFIKTYFWMERSLGKDGRHIYHRTLTISASKRENDSIKDSYDYVFEDSQFPDCYAFSDSSLIIFTSEKAEIPKKFRSKIIIEPIIEHLSYDSLQRKYKDIQILTFL